MKRIITFLVAVLCTMSLAGFQAAAQMTDDQVINYVKQASAEGKSEKQIGKELVAKGVTAEQAKRIKSQFENSQSGESRVAEQISRVRGNSSASQETGKQSQSLPQSRMDSGFQQTENVDRKFDRTGGEDETYSDALDVDKRKSLIFGHDIFSGKDLSFEPNMNAATPDDYKLGPGDEVIIDIWGYNEATVRETISPEGRIFISQVGPINLNGVTIKDAAEKIRKQLKSKYANMGGSVPKTNVSITLGQVRTVQVNIMGEVNMPGTYRVSGFATVFTALYRAGGVSEVGTMRSIKVVRAGAEIAKVDVYEYIFKGASDSDIRLQDGDIIIVSPYEKLVSVEGGVKRPMIYELKDGETLKDAIDYCGGFVGGAYNDEITVERQSGAEKSIATVANSRMSAYRMEDGDKVTVGKVLDRYSNRVELRGYVFRPGMFQIGNGINTVKDLIQHAGGLTEDALLSRALVIREKSDLSLENRSFNLGALMNGTAPDIELRKNDIVIISGKFDLEDKGLLTINGYVFAPGTYPYAENTTIEDLILQAGGLMDGASLARVDVARRVSDNKSIMATDTLSKSYTFSIKDGLVIGDESFKLQPFDVVSVRKSPTFKPLQFVKLSGEVAFPGDYVVQNEGETLSQILERAGGVTRRAYLHGAVLERESAKEDKILANATRRMINMGASKDSMNVERLALDGKFTVAIDLDKAVSRPGSEYDLVVRGGDHIFVPEYQSTVHVKGCVMYPNTITYIPGRGLDYYINGAGGYGNRAKTSKVYVVYQNGSVAKGIGAKIEPGCQIIVPEKDARQKMSASEILSIGSSSASLATMIMSLVNLFR